MLRRTNRLMSFLMKIYSRGDCWEWRGVRNRTGHGRFAWNPALGIGEYAHRHAYELAKGSIPPGLEIDHLCRHPWCVRPSHLEVVDHATNDLRGESFCARKARQTHCVHGHTLSDAYRYPDARGCQHRVCRKCRAIHSAQYKRARKTP